MCIGISGMSKGDYTYIGGGGGDNDDDVDNRN
jgi:hypothetical protein